MICISMKGKHTAVSIQLHNNIQVISQINRLNRNRFIVKIDKKIATHERKQKKKFFFYYFLRVSNALNILIIIMMMSISIRSSLWPIHH